MLDLDDYEDAELLRGEDRAAEAFGAFYRRHVDVVLRFCARRGLNATEAADLTAETFAAALLARRRYRPRAGEARSWLLGIAGHKLADRARRWSREQRAQRRLALEAIELTACDLDDFAALRAETQSDALRALEDLPATQRAAVRARVVDEQDYAAIGLRLGVSEAAARQRVSRGLAALHSRLKEER